MKKTILTLATAISLFFAGCKKDTDVSKTEEKITKPQKSAVIDYGGGGGAGTGYSSYVVQDADGNYGSAYAGGMNFGTYFPHPTSVPAYEEGKRYSPGDLVVYPDGGGIISFTQNGASFVLIRNTVIGQYPVLTGPISTFKSEFNDYMKGTKPVMPNFKTIAERYGIDGSGFIQYPGTFVYDSASPTKIRISTNVFPVIEEE
ncbi:hypothetical protein ACFE6N_16130 [Pedobacter sp. BG31]|uniref:hypothetical protein n=1 Tax=Pedobacter sp. BG31 TaxID=3349697 RepID=UPI0035F48217